MFLELGSYLIDIHRLQSRPFWVVESGKFTFVLVHWLIYRLVVFVYLLFIFIFHVGVDRGCMTPIFTGTFAVGMVPRTVRLEGSVDELYRSLLFAGTSLLRGARCARIRNLLTQPWEFEESNSLFRSQLMDRSRPVRCLASCTRVYGVTHARGASFVVVFTFEFPAVAIGISVNRVPWELIQLSTNSPHHDTQIQHDNAEETTAAAHYRCQDDWQVHELKRKTARSLRSFFMAFWPTFTRHL